MGLYNILLVPMMQIWVGDVYKIVCIFCNLSLGKVVEYPDILTGLLDTIWDVSLIWYNVECILI